MPRKNIKPRRKVPSRSIVVDASIARAAGGESAQAAGSRGCRDFLQTMLDVCHHVALPPELWREWKDHKSMFARTWLTAMFARGKVEKDDIAIDANLRKDIVEDCQSRKELDQIARDSREEAMLKDVHLIEAARQTDRLIASLDEKARSHFRSAAGSVPALRDVVWVNPGRAVEGSIDWLATGALSEPQRRLG